jgi:hypothetical protein
MHPSPAQTRRIGVSAGQGGRDGPGRTCATTTHGFLGGTERGLSGRCSGSGTAQLGRCAAGGRRWQVGGRRGYRLADDGQVVQQGVEGLVVEGAHDGSDELLDLVQHPVQDGLPDGVRSTRTRRRSAGLRCGIRCRLTRPQGCGAAHHVSWRGPLNANDAN